MRVSPDGRRYVFVQHGLAPAVTLVERGARRQVLGVGQDPRWASTTTVWWRPQDDSGLRAATEGDAATETSLRSGNSLAAAGARVARHRTDPRRVLDTVGGADALWPGLAWPVLSDDGRYLAALWPDGPHQGQQSVVLLGPGGARRTLHEGAVTEGTAGTNFRMAGTSLCFQEADGRVYGVADVSNPEARPVLLARAGEGVSHAAPVWAPDAGLFVLHVRDAGGGQSRVCLATWGSMAAGAPEGWELARSSGGGYDHDARPVAAHPTYALAAWVKPDGADACAVLDLRDARVPLAPPQEPPEPFGVPVQGARALGYFFGKRSKYGAHPECRENCAVLPLDAWQDGDGSLPADVGDQLRATLREVGLGVVSNTAVPHAAPEWGRVLAVLAGRQEGRVWVHEPASRAEADALVAETRAQVHSAGLPSRPVVVILREELAADPQFVGCAGALAPEIYFRVPEADYATMLAVARDRIARVLAGLAPDPVFLCVQAFDRSGARAWQDAPWALEAIQQAANEAIAEGRVLGLWWFAYARPGGVLAYPQLADWHHAQLAVTPAPAAPVDPTPPDPKPPETTMTHDELRGYMAALDDPLIFGALKRFHDEVLPRDRPGDPVIKSAEGGDFSTADVTTGGAMAYFLRHYCVEAAIAQDKGRTAAQASGDGYDKAIAAYRKVTGQNPQ